MKKWLFIGMLLLQKLSFSQAACDPAYPLPVQRLTVSGDVSLGYVEAGKGKTIVLLHGLGGNLSHWLPVVESLSDQYHVVAVDFPGYGVSDKVLPDTTKSALQFYAEAVAGLIQKKGWKEVVLAGHSMGGQVAVITALQHPALIDQLVLVAPAGLETFTTQESALLLSASQPAFFARQEEAAIRAGFNANFFEMPREGEELIRYRLRLRDCPDFTTYTEVVSGGIKGMLTHPVRDSLSQLRQPVLIVFGEQDGLIPNRYLHPALKRGDLVAEAARDIPKSKTTSIPNAGHLVQFEKPVEVSQAIKNFLQ